MLARRLALLPLALLAAYAAADIRYTVKPEIAAKTVRVSMAVDNPGKSVEFRIPAWSPGYYFIQNYERKISDVVASDPTGKRLQFTHGDPRAWVVSNPTGGAVTLSYRVLGDDAGLGFFAVNVHPHTAFINGPAAFMYVPTRLEDDAKVSFQLPAGWQVATAMDRTGDAYSAANYDELVDHPIQVGVFERRKFTVQGIPFEALFVSPNGKYNARLDDEAKKLEALSQPALRMMGGAAFPRYLYLVHLATGNFSGGLEHRSSTVLAVGNDSELHLDDLATHEFFHAWNVKQIRPKVLGPFDYSKPVFTKNLWFAEGVTDYYAKLHAFQAGIWTEDELLGSLGYEIRTLQVSKFRSQMTLEDTSIRAWDNGGMGVGDLSYYNKGQIAGFVLDAAIRTQTQGAKSLDDVMRMLYVKGRLPHAGYEEDELRTTINSVAGTDLSALYDQVARSKEEVPYEVLRGLGLRLRAPDDKVLDLHFSAVGNRVSSVSKAAAASGLLAGDIILSVNSVPLENGELANADPSKPVVLEVQRSGETRQITIQPTTSTSNMYMLEVDPLASGEATQRRMEWLRGSRG